MICKQCGAEYPDGGRFCPACGAPALPTQAQQTYDPNQAASYAKSAPTGAPEQPYQQHNSYYYTAPPTYSAPAPDSDTFFRYHPEYRPLSPWAYFGYTLLYTIPIIGFIFLIIHSVSDDNLIRRNFARSYWCVLLVALIISAISGVIIGTMGSGVFYEIFRHSY